MIDLKSVADRFRGVYGHARDLVFARAPGRVNLIGEHTDYNDGFVLPMAIEREIVLVGHTVEGETVSAYSMDFDQSAQFSLTDLDRREPTTWLNYPKGVAHFLRLSGVKVPAFQAVIAGDVPIGGGLSSSAAFEVASAAFLLTLAGTRMQPVALARLARRAENEFVGVKCGIMDQFIAVMGRKDHALLIDCRTLAHRHIPTFGEEFEFVVCDTGVKHELASTEYHQRQAECRQAVEALKKLRGEIRALRDATPKDLAGVESSLSEVVVRRARHVITENERVQEAVSALTAHEAIRFGELMDRSHASLRDDYAVSCVELDTMVDLARKSPGVLGARMTGGGFGGCTVNLVRATNAEEFGRNIVREYGERTGLTARLIRSRAADGVRTGRLA